MTEFKTVLENRLDILYAERRDHLANGLCNTHPKPETDYAYRTGYLAAIRDIGDMIKEVTREVNGD